MRNCLRGIEARAFKLSAILVRIADDQKEKNNLSFGVLLRLAYCDDISGYEAA